MIKSNFFIASTFFQSQTKISQPVQSTLSQFLKPSTNQPTSNRNSCIANKKHALLVPFVERTDSGHKEYGQKGQRSDARHLTLAELKCRMVGDWS